MLKLYAKYQPFYILFPPCVFRAATRAIEMKVKKNQKKELGLLFGNYLNSQRIIQSNCRIAGIVVINEIFVIFIVSFSPSEKLFRTTKSQPHQIKNSNIFN